MIHTVLRHDKIVDNHDPDFALVEIEAQKIAEEAIRALKESRKYCKPAESGIPNLTGVKFGGKLKIPTSTTSGDGAQSSKSLLDRIRLRNQGIHVDESPTKLTLAAKEINQTDEELDESLRESDETNPIDRTVKMSKMIQRYLTRTSRTYNRASTEQIVDYFKDRLGRADSVKFKAVLKSLCEFDKRTRTWSLRDEYLDDQQNDD